MEQSHPSGIALRPTFRPQVESVRRGYLEHMNRPLQPLAETINGRSAYGNGEKAFFVEAENVGSRIMLRVTELVGRERSPYELLCKLEVEQGSIRIKDIQNIYPGSEPDLISMHEPPLPEWRGLGFFRIILEHTKKLAAEKGIHRISIDPDNADLGVYCSKFGFVRDPEREFRMQLTF